MTERKVKIRLITLGVLILLTISAYFLLPDNSGGKPDKNLFRPARLENVDKIILRADQEMVLTFNNGRWWLNNTYIADRQMIQVFFATLDQAIPKRKIQGSQQDSIYAQTGKNRVSVQIFEAEKRVLAFDVLGDALSRKTFYADPNAEALYQVIIPGYSAYVAFIFQQDIASWRDKLVLDYNWRNFQGLEMSYAQTPENNFSVRSDEEYFKVINLPQTDTTRLNDYIDFISLLYAEKWLAEGEDAQVDSLAITNPDALLVISDIANRNRKIEFWVKQLNNRHLARLDEKDLFLIETEDLKEILKKQIDFLPSRQP